MEASIMRFNTSALVIDYTASTRGFVCPQIRSPKELSQVTSVA